MATLGSLLTMAEFAKREGVTLKTVRKAIKKGRIRIDNYWKWRLIHPRETLARKKRE